MEHSVAVGKNETKKNKILHHPERPKALAAGKN